MTLENDVSRHCSARENHASAIEEILVVTLKRLLHVPLLSYRRAFHTRRQALQACSWASPLIARSMLSLNRDRASSSCHIHQTRYEIGSNPVSFGASVGISCHPRVSGVRCVRFYTLGPKKGQSLQTFCLETGIILTCDVEARYL